MIKDFNYKVIDYKASDVNGSTLFYVLGIKTDKVDFKEYSIRNGAEVEVPAAYQEQFIISMHSNATVACKWLIEYDHNSFKMIDQYFFLPNKEQTTQNQVVGGSERRENFRFEVVKRGSSTMLIKQVSEDEKTVYKTIKLDVLAK